MILLLLVVSVPSLAAPLGKVADVARHPVHLESAVKKILGVLLPPLRFGDVHHIVHDAKVDVADGGRHSVEDLGRVARVHHLLGQIFGCDEVAAEVKLRDAAKLRQLGRRDRFVHLDVRGNGGDGDETIDFGEDGLLLQLGGPLGHSTQSWASRGK